jgi:hypothetical protein
MPETNPDPTNDTIGPVQIDIGMSSNTPKQQPVTTTETPNTSSPTTPNTEQQTTSQTTNATNQQPTTSQTTAGKKEESVMNYLEKIYMYLFLGYIIKDGKMQDNVIFRMFKGKIGRAVYLMILYRIMIVISGFFITMFLQNERGTFIYLVIASWVAYLSYSFILVDTYP